MRFTRTAVSFAAFTGICFAQSSSSNASSPVIFQLSSDGEFAYQLEQTISLSEGFGANTGEVLRAASQVIPSDFESYYDAFYYLGTQIQDFADGLNSTKYSVSARDAYFRASSYLRSSIFFLTGNTTDPRLYTVWNQAVTDYDKAMALMEHPGVRYNISAPLDVRPNFTAPIIVYKPDNTNATRPTVLWGNGYDGPMEDGYHAYGRWVLERGWNFVAYEGPGQNTVLREQHIGFQPDWWNVVSPIVSFLGNRSDVDPSRIALVGQSYGGLLAPRAATREHRLAAVIALDGAYNLKTSFLDQIGTELDALFQNNVTAFDVELDFIRNNASYPSSLRWSINQGLWSFDTSIPHVWLDLADNINFTQADVVNVPMPVFIGSGQNDTSFLGQAPVVQSWFGNKAFSYNFTNALGAGQHCQVGAEGQATAISLDWLLDVFENITSTTSAQTVSQNGAETFRAGQVTMFLTAFAMIFTFL